MKQQSLNAQKGEIAFRKKLVQQHVKRERIFRDEFDAESLETILRGRMERTHEHMTLLKRQGIPLSPYIEIGAERCQRTLVMENDLEARGAAIDISYDMLKSCEHYRNTFHKHKTPLKVCCDANALPFMGNTLPFIFCYETLHHFPDPTPIVREIHRVLSPGGYFFFAEEPYKRMLHINLYQAQKLYSKERQSQSKIKNFFDFFFAELNCNEREYNIIENHDIPVNTWKKALHIFEEKHVTLKSLRGTQAELFHPKRYKRFLLACLLGGEITGICRKVGECRNENISIDDVLICPSCLRNEREAPLTKKDSSCFVCTKCKKKFPLIGDIIFLFSYEKLQKLYPEVFESLCDMS